MHLGLKPMLLYCNSIPPLATALGWRENLQLALGSLLFVCGIAICGVIAWAASNGRPQNFDRWMWWTAFMLFQIPGAIICIYAQRMEPAGAWREFVQHVLLTLGILLVFIAWGCGLAIFTYRCRTPPPTE
jgi:hypothetical protein